MLDSRLGVDEASFLSPSAVGACLGVDKRSSVLLLIFTPGLSFFSSSLFSSSFLAEEGPLGRDRSAPTHTDRWSSDQHCNNNRKQSCIVQSLQCWYTDCVELWRCMSSGRDRDRAGTLAKREGSVRRNEQKQISNETKQAIYNNNKSEQKKALTNISVHYQTLVKPWDKWTLIPNAN